MIGTPVFRAWLHDLDDLLAGDLAEGAAEDGEVLAVDRDLAAVDRADAGDDGVAVRALGLHAERVGAVPDELVELDERAVVEQLVDALAGGLLALGVLLLDRGLAARGHGLVVALLEVGELAGGRDRSGSGGLTCVRCRSRRSLYRPVDGLRR